MKRRRFIALAGGAAISWPQYAVAQARADGPAPVVGVLMGIPATDPEVAVRSEAFERALQKLGWERGRNISIEYRWAGDDPARLRDAARELVALPCAVIVGRATSVMSALFGETHSIPLVAAGISDPVTSGFAESFARPGRNVTGFVNYVPSLAEKWIEFLRSIAPRTQRVILLYNPEALTFTEHFEAVIEAAAPSLGIEPVRADVRSEDDIARALADAARDGTAALMVIPDTFMLSHRSLIVKLAATHRLPAIYPNRTYVESGGLLSYSINTLELIVSAAGYVDRILKGARPGELPIQQPTKYELVINLRTAKALGIEIPSALLARADEVIE
jgi:putative ABC transport system substrate-binding protein